MNQRDTRNKYRATVRESKSKIYRAWKTKETYKKFEELQETLLEGRWQLEDRLAAFWKAYCTMATEHGLVEGVEVPEEYKGEIKLAPQEEEESLEQLVNKSVTTNIVGDFFWAYSSVPNSVTPADAPSAGARFFLDMKKTNKHK